MGTERVDPDSDERPSTTGRPNPRVDMTDWRRKLQESRLKFDDDQKKVYLEVLAETGLKGKAARAAGVALSTVQGHRKNDPIFAEQEEDAWQARCDFVRGNIEKDAVEGHERTYFDKEGNVTREERVYETQIRAMMLKRHDPEYRDKLDMNVTGAAGGVLIIPARLSMEEWEALYSPKDEPPAEEAILE